MVGLRSGIEELNKCFGGNGGFYGLRSEAGGLSLTNTIGIGLTVDWIF